MKLTPFKKKYAHLICDLYKALGGLADPFFSAPSNAAQSSKTAAVAFFFKTSSAALLETVTPSIDVPILSETVRLIFIALRLVDRTSSTLSTLAAERKFM